MRKQTRLRMGAALLLHTCTNRCYYELSMAILECRSIKIPEAPWPCLCADLQGVNVCSGVATIFEMAIDNL